MPILDRGHFQFSEDKYVTRTMKCLPDKFTELCHMHLAFLLDLSGNKLELLLSTQDIQRKKKSGLVSFGMFKKKDKSQAALFGLPLTDEGVCLMIPLIKFLTMEKNISKIGLFRKPGNKSRMTALRELLVTHGPAADIDPDIYSPYDVACVLKEFLRELPEPLLTERHMEAHRQVLALGQHASTPEEIARYANRKLSALQLLMLLLPPPAQKLTMHLTRLLQRIADCADTKMTSATLGTIFAPIFFIDKRVEPAQLCSQIAETTPAVSFMIDRAHQLFQAPKELVADLTNYWTELGQVPQHLANITEFGQMKKSLSGRTLNTSVCYIDRKLSLCDDVTSNTQAELASLIAHVQTLPNTPQNAKLKKQIMKTGGTPVMSIKKRQRSRSITASIRKRLPSLSRLKNEQGPSSSTNTSIVASTDSKNLAHISADLGSPVCSREMQNSRRPSRLGHKRHYTSDNENIYASIICTPPKQIFRDAESSTTTTSNINNQKPTSKNSSAGHIVQKSELTNKTLFPELLDHDKSMFPKSLPKTKSTFIQPESTIDCRTHNREKQISSPVTPSNDRKLVTKTHLQQCRKQGTPIMPRAVLRLVPCNTPESSF